MTSLKLHHLPGWTFRAAGQKWFCSIVYTQIDNEQHQWSPLTKSRAPTCVVNIEFALNSKICRHEQRKWWTSCLEAILNHFCCFTIFIFYIKKHKDLRTTSRPARWRWLRPSQRRWFSESYSSRRTGSRCCSQRCRSEEEEEMMKVMISSLMTFYFLY